MTTTLNDAAVAGADPAGAASARIQTGLRMDRSVLKVLKGLAEYLDISLADLVEAVVLHALEGKVAISSPGTLDVIEQLRKVYGLQLTSLDSHTRPEPDDHD